MKYYHKLGHMNEGISNLLLGRDRKPQEQEHFFGSIKFAIQIFTGHRKNLFCNFAVSYLMKNTFLLI